MRARKTIIRKGNVKLLINHGEPELCGRHCPNCNAQSRRISQCVAWCGLNEWRRPTFAAGWKSAKARDAVVQRLIGGREGGGQRMSGSIGPLLNRWRTSHIEKSSSRTTTSSLPFLSLFDVSRIFSLSIISFLLLAFYILRLFSITFGYNFDHLPPDPAATFNVFFTAIISLGFINFEYF